MFKKLPAMIGLAICSLQYAFAQDASFNNLTINGLIKQGGADSYSGWGLSTTNTLDPRPNYSIGTEPFIINHHTGLTFSAHSYYGGIRFYNQGYPGGPFDASNGAKMVMSLTNGSVGIGTTNPLAKLEVNGGINIAPATASESGGIAYSTGSQNFNYTNASGTYKLNHYGMTIAWMPGSAATYLSGYGELGLFTGGSNRLHINSGGNIGIGTTTPTEKLSVNGNIQISNAAIPMGLITELGGTVSPLLNMSVNFRESNKNTTHRGGAIRIDARDGLPIFQWLSRAAGSSIENELMALTEDGKLGIGTMSPAEKLSVNGKIRAKEIKVESANWPDYVFEEDYKPASLQETEAFIKEHKHLPEMPSEAEVKAEGISLGEMNAKLLKKIEELTLHLIEQNKLIQEQNQRIEKLEKNN